MDQMKTTQTASQLYSQLEGARDPYLRRARDAAVLTIPTLMPPEARSSSTDYPTPWQSVGARGVNNISNKLLLAVLPPNQPFFRFMYDQSQIEDLSDDPEAKTLVDKAFGNMERQVMQRIEENALRAPTLEAFRQLVNSGNALAYKIPNGTLKVYRLDSYVVKRDPVGNVLDIVATETISIAALPEEIREFVMNDLTKYQGYAANVNCTVDIFTHVCLDAESGKYNVYQEVAGEKVPGSEGSYKESELPWLALRWNALPGEDYGRGHVEEYYGDLRSLEYLTKSIVEVSAASAKLNVFVSPTGVTKKREVAEAKNGAVLSGNAGDVTVLQMGKAPDMQISMATANNIESRLSFAFQLNSAVQRGGERVTAEEIRYVARELEDTLGGQYSVLSQEFQLPLVRLVMAELQSEGKLPKLPKGMISPTITTGIDALGRGNDLTRLDDFIRGVAAVFGTEAIAKYVNVSNYMDRRGTALGIDTKGLVRTEQELQQEAAMAAQMQQQQQAMELAGKVAPAAIGATASVYNQSQKGDTNGSTQAAQA